jgi:hypothetical protein
MPRLVTGVFYERSEAERAVAALRAQGIPAEDIYLETEVPPDPDVGWKGGEVSRLEQERRFAGLETGILMGLTFGLLSGLGISILGGTLQEWALRDSGSQPVTMPILLANPWLAALMGALTGLVAGGVIGWIVDFTLSRLGAGPPLPAHEALVTVRTDEENLDRVRSALFGARARHIHVAERAAF